MVVGLSFAPEHRIGPLLAPIAKIGGLRGLLPAGHRGPWLPLLEALAERGCRCPVSAGAAQSAPSLRSRASTGISWQPTFQSRVMRPPMAPMMAPPMLLTMRTMLGIGSP